MEVMAPRAVEEIALHPLEEVVLRYRAIMSKLTISFAAFPSAYISFCLVQYLRPQITGMTPEISCDLSIP